MSAEPRSAFRSPILARIRHAAAHLRAAELGIRHRHRNLPLVKEYRPHLELAAVTHRKPYTVLEFLIANRKTEPLEIRPQEDLHRRRNLERQAGLDVDRLEF